MYIPLVSIYLKSSSLRDLDLVLHKRLDLQTSQSPIVRSKILDGIGKGCTLKGSGLLAWNARGIERQERLVAPETGDLPLVAGGASLLGTGSL
jgi:hypothetical protein